MAFSGRAVYDTGVFDGIAEDVSPMISMISPYETPLLDLIGDADRPAANVLHEWLEDALQPDTIVASCNIASTNADTALGIAAGLAKFIKAGALLQMGKTYSAELVQVSAISGNTITVSRAFGGTTSTSYGAGYSISVISDTELEGADVSVDTSRPRSRKTNYIQLFKKDIIVSGTVQSVSMLGGITDEFNHQQQARMKELLKNLEKNIIVGKLSGNTLGSGTAYRTMKGLISFLATNIVSIGTIVDSSLGSVIQAAWSYGGVDIDVICADDAWKRQIDWLATSRLRQIPDEVRFRSLITYYESSYGTQQCVMSRWMPTTTLLALATPRVSIVPLAGRSFAYTPIAPTGDAQKGMIVGEYTLELKNEEGMAFAHL
jgi:hypothetical protein